MSSHEYTDTVDISAVRFTIAKINPTFSCGRTISETMEEVRSGKISVSALPQMTLMKDSAGNLYSLNNRRLFLMKALAAEGAFQPPIVSVRVKTIPDTKRFSGKYTPERCSLRAIVLPGGATRAARQALGRNNDGKEEGCVGAKEETEEDVGMDPTLCTKAPLTNQPVTTNQKKKKASRKGTRRRVNDSDDDGDSDGAPPRL